MNNNKTLSNLPFQTSITKFEDYRNHDNVVLQDRENV